MAATITFKVKLEKLQYTDGSVAYTMAKCPILDRKHCDMAAFRRHPRYGGIANSDLFKNVLAHIRRDKFGDAGVIRTDRLPDNVSIDESGFMAVVTITV